MKSLLQAIACAAIVICCCSAFIYNIPVVAVVPPSDSTINNCNLDVRSPIFAIDSLTGSKAIVYGKYNQTYKDVEYFGCNGFVNTFCQYDTGVLKYYVYYPKNHNYDSCPLPALVMFHGGGFSDCNSIDSAKYLSYACAEMAKRGFVVYNINYRLGALYDYVDPAYLSAQQVLGSYRAIQDGRGALRSIIKRQRNKNTFHDPYSIDTNKIFLGGESAGSVIALCIAYYQSQSMLDAITPGVKAVLGSINPDYYYGDSTISYQKKIKGVMNMWGNVFLPVTAFPDPTSFFAANTNNPPAISFHGKLDSIAPYGLVDIHFAPATGLHSLFNSEGHCLVSGNKYKLFPSATGPDMYSSGSEQIYNFLKKKGIPTELYLDCQMEHGIDADDDPDGFQSNFGTNATNNYSIYNYMVQRTAVFFQAVVNNKAKDLVDTKFTECENKRFGCSTQNNNNGCKNTDACPPLITAKK